MAHTKNGDDSGLPMSGAMAGSPVAPTRLPRSFPAARQAIPMNYGQAGGPSGGSALGGEGSGGTGGGGGNTATQRPQAPAPSSTGVDLRQVFTGATLKKIIGLPHVLADAVLAKIKHPSGGAVTAIAPDKSDVYVTYQDIISGAYGIGRLFAPHSIFWRLPTNGASAMVVKPSEADGTGVPYVLHGDGGNPRATPVPDWLDQNNCGIQAPEMFHIESTGQGVMIKAVTSNGALTSNVYLKSDGSIDITGGQGANITINASGGASVVVNGGALNVARVTDQVQGTAGPYPIANGVISGPGATNFKA